MFVCWLLLYIYIYLYIYFLGGGYVLCIYYIYGVFFVGFIATREGLNKILEILVGTNWFGSGIMLLLLFCQVIF